MASGRESAVSAGIRPTALWVDALPCCGAGRATNALPPSGSRNKAAYQVTVAVIGPTGIMTVSRPRQYSTISSRALLPVADTPVTILSCPGTKRTSRRCPAALYTAR